MILDEILAETRRTVAVSRDRVPFDEIRALASVAAAPRSLAGAIRATAGVACIAEFKRRSPSKGWIHRSAEVTSVARLYQAAGAAGMSVLTDTPYFGGSLDDLRLARAAVKLPVLRKDFIIDSYQVAEARAAGADAVLLIVAALSKSELPALLAEIELWGMEALVEAHEVARAVAVGAQIIGVNHRDLRTFTMNMDLAVTMRPLVPAGQIMVAESGIKTGEDVERLAAAGIDAVLVGETLMQAPDPAAELRALLGRP
jgi:indole-3-glycerol phosphate synthase